MGTDSNQQCRLCSKMSVAHVHYNKIEFCLKGQGTLTLVQDSICYGSAKNSTENLEFRAEISTTRRESTFELSSVALRIIQITNRIATITGVTTDS